MSVTLTKEQRAVVRRVLDWFVTGRDPDIRIGGLAGTGKTTIAGAIPEALGLSPDEVAYCAYTGKAADVLSRRLRGDTKASTIHRLIYQPVEHHCRDCPVAGGGERCHGASCGGCGVSFQRVYDLGQVQLVICDEASMVSEEIYEDLIDYDVPVVWIGDHGQLPPVKSDFNLMDEPDLRLEKVHRQAEGSPILKLAAKARQGERIPLAEYAPGVLKRVENGSLEWSDERAEDQVILCGYNRTRVAINRAIRDHRGFPSDRPVRATASSACGTTRTQACSTAAPARSRTSARTDAASTPCGSRSTAAASTGVLSPASSSTARKPSTRSTAVPTCGTTATASPSTRRKALSSPRSRS